MRVTNCLRANCLNHPFNNFVLLMLIPLFVGFFVSAPNAQRSSAFFLSKSSVLCIMCCQSGASAYQRHVSIKTHLECCVSCCALPAALPESRQQKAIRPTINVGLTRWLSKCHQIQCLRNLTRNWGVCIGRCRRSPMTHLPPT